MEKPKITGIMNAIILRCAGSIPGEGVIICTGGSTGFSQLPLWVPDYTTAPSPGMPAGWADWFI